MKQTATAWSRTHLPMDYSKLLGCPVVVESLPLHLRIGSVSRVEQREGGVAVTIEIELPPS